MITPLLLAALASFPVSAATGAAPARPALLAADLDSTKLEQALQRLSWKQFRSVVESEPRLKAGIDAYGPAGWQFVQANYRRYAWRKTIDKLDERQKRRLAEQIRIANGGR